MEGANMAAMIYVVGGSLAIILNYVAGLEMKDISLMAAALLIVGVIEE